MKRSARFGWILLPPLAAGALYAQTPGSPAPAPERGKAVFQTHCAVCHGATGVGDGPAAYLLSPRARDLTRGSFKVRSTATGSLPTDGDLFRTVTRGMPGTAMPLWEHLPEADRRALVDYVKTLSPRFQSEEPAEVLPVPEPPGDLDRLVPAGRLAYEKYRCGECHGATGRGDGPSSATLKDDTGFPIRPYDFTRPGRYKGGDAPKDVYRTFTTGFDGTPMPSYAGAIPEEDRWAIVAYVRSLSTPESPALALAPGGVIPAERMSAIPTEPDAPAWEKAGELEIPMRQLWGRENVVGRVRVAAATDGKKLAIRMRWADTTLDARMLRPEEFRDAAAVQFSLAGPDVTFAMGERGKPVAIWHWKADWQRDIAGREDVESAEPAMVVDLYPFARGQGTAEQDAAYLTGNAAGNAFSQLTRRSPVESLVAAGIGSLTPRPSSSQNVAGKGVWASNEWKVVFIRSLEPAGEGDARLSDGLPVAFAVWNGSEADRDGIKAFSTWYRLGLPSRN
ncbi:MAG: ethylbenzene dehydrogenase-related protein [Thermoanaerobaculia bacterium]